MHPPETFHHEPVVDIRRGYLGHGSMLLATAISVAWTSALPGAAKDDGTVQAMFDASSQRGSAALFEAPVVRAPARAPHWDAALRDDLRMLKISDVAPDVVALAEKVARAWGSRFGAVPMLDRTGDGGAVIRTFDGETLAGASVEVAADGRLVFNVADREGRSVDRGIVRPADGATVDDLISRIAAAVDHGILA